MRAVIYTRVSTDERATSGLGLEAQLAACQAVIAVRGWELVTTCTDEGLPGTVPPRRRPALNDALEMLCTGGKKGRKADVLVVAKLDRLARSAFDLLWMRREADQCKFELVILDPDMDTTTAAGRLQFTMFAGFAEYERELISERTRGAAMAKKARGYRLGAPVRLNNTTRARIAQLRAEGVSIAKIAKKLNAEGLTRVNGGAWTKSAVQKVLRSIELDAEAAAVGQGPNC